MDKGIGRPLWQRVELGEQRVGLLARVEIAIKAQPRAEASSKL